MGNGEWRIRQKKRVTTGATSTTATTYDKAVS